MIDAATNHVVATIPVGLSPSSVAIAKDGTRAYVVNNVSGTVSVIDTASNHVVATVPVGIGPLKWPSPRMGHTPTSQVWTQGLSR